MLEFEKVFCEIQYIRIKNNLDITYWRIVMIYLKFGFFLNKKIRDFKSQLY